MFDRLAALPADAWNWDDRRAGPSLREAQARVPGAVIGGLDQWSTLQDASPEAALAQIQDALAQTSGRGIFLGAGCVLPTGTSDATLVSIAKTLGGVPKLGFLRPQ
jgi:uroporphyrinogen decarboxylase